MNRFARTRSEKCARHPLPPPRAQWSVGSIDDDGIRYGLTTHALIASTIAIAPTIVTTQSMIARHGCGTPSRVSGLSLPRAAAGAAGGPEARACTGPGWRLGSAHAAAPR